MNPAKKLSVLVLLGFLLFSSEAFSQAGAPSAHTIFMTVIELKGATTTDKLAPPPVNPKATISSHPVRPIRMTRKNGRYQATGLLQAS